MVPPELIYLRQVTISRLRLWKEDLAQWSQTKSRRNYIKEDTMKCNKCGGLMIYERFLSQEFEDFSGWRCVACGEIVDEVILKNRTKG